MEDELVGRHDVLALAFDALKRGVRGDPRPIIVEGGPGAGKTAFLAALCTYAARVGAAVIRARPGEVDEVIPYSCIRRLTPGAAGTDDVSPTQLARALRDKAAGAPMFVVIDDAQWADGATLALLPALATDLAPDGLLALAHLPVAPLSPLARALTQLAVLDPLAVRLEPLDEFDATALAAGLVGGDLSDELAETLRVRSPLSPLLVRQIVLPHRTVPVDDRGEQTAAVADAVAVLGRVALGVGAVRDAVGLMAGCSNEAADAALDALVADGLLTAAPDGGLEFAQPAVRTSRYDALGPVGRRRLHRLAAESLRAARDAGAMVPREVMVAHVAASAEAGDEDAVALLVEAADATQDAAPDLSVAWYQSALSLQRRDAPPVQRGTILGKLALAQLSAEQVAAAAQTAGEALVCLPPGRRWARAAAARVSALNRLGRANEALTEVRRLLQDASEASGDELQATTVAALHNAGHVREAARLGRLALDRGLADPLPRVGVLVSLAGAEFATGDFAAAIVHVDEAARLAATRSRPLHGSALTVKGLLLAQMGRLPAAQQALTEAARLADALHVAAPVEMIEVGWAYVGWLAGEWDRAEAAARRALTSAVREGSARHFGSAVAPMLPIHVARGEFKTVRQALAGSDAPADAAAGRGALWSGWVRGSMRSVLGDHGAALDELARTWHLSGESASGGYGAFLLAALVEAAAAVGDRSALDRWCGELAGLSDRTGEAFHAALTLRGHALREGDASAAAAAAEAFAGLGMRFESARSLLFAAELGGGGDHAAAALGVFDSLGARPWRQRAAAALRAHGRAAPRARRPRQQGLTTVEAEVAHLVAEGLSNPEIAAALSYSRKTVEGYLSRIYAKTGLRSRSELAVAVAAGDVS